MEEKKTIKRVRWYLRYKGEMGWSSLMNSTSIVYFDSFQSLAERVAERVDANPDMQFKFEKEYYWALAWLYLLFNPNSNICLILDDILGVTYEERLWGGRTT